MRANQNDLTKLYLQLCYTCTDAHKCDTEAKCMQCFVEKEMADKEPLEGNQTDELLRQYAF